VADSLKRGKKRECFMFYTLSLAILLIKTLPHCEAGLKSRQIKWEGNVVRMGEKREIRAKFWCGKN
jgi:hypothetical protein